MNMSLENTFLESVSSRHTISLYFKTSKHCYMIKSILNLKIFLSLLLNFYFYLGSKVEKKKTPRCLIARLIQYPYPPYNKYIIFRNISQSRIFIFIWAKCRKSPRFASPLELYNIPTQRESNGTQIENFLYKVNFEEKSDEGNGNCGGHWSVASLPILLLAVDISSDMGESLWD